MEKQGLIDYICFNIQKSEDEEEFFNDVLDSITKRYGIIFINKKIMQWFYI